MTELSLLRRARRALRHVVPAMAAVGLLLTGCGSQAQPPLVNVAAKDIRPALWKVTGPGGGTAYLFGTIHVLPKGIDWQTTKVEKAIAASDVLVLEATGLDDQKAISSEFQKLATDTSPPPLLTRVPDEQREGLARVIKNSGLDAANLDRYETWGAVLLLSGKSQGKEGLTVGDGVEPVLMRQFGKAGKPVTGIETVEEQFGFFNSLPEAAQDKLLTQLIEQADMARDDYRAIVTAWLKGDEKAILALFDKDLRDSPELADALIRKRNAHWANWIGARLKTPQTLFVAVGAGHLVGADSVPALLKAQGYAVARME